MNVFFVLLTTVSAGDSCCGTAVHAAPVASASCGCSDGCCGTVSDCCEKPKRRGLFARRSKSCDTCCDTCAPVCSAPACAPTSCCGTVSSCCDTCCEAKPRRRLFGRRSKDCCATPCCDSGCGSGCGDVVHPAPAHGHIIAPAIPVAPATPNTKPAETIKKMPKADDKPGEIEKPKGASIMPQAPVTPTGAKVETEAKNPFELARRYETRVGRAADYSKLTGQLYFVHADGGLWVLRYAPLSEEDAHGGSVVLARGLVMNNYREGDLVTVAGQVISQKASRRLGGALYQVRTMSLVDRPQD